MKILIVEDSDNKVKKIISFLKSIKNKNIDIDCAFSYTTGLNKAIDNEYNLLILDMSIPTYEKSSNEAGGRSRIFGGKEIVRQLQRENKLKPFIILTQYNKFDDNNKIKSLDEIETQLEKKFKEFHLKTIYYDTSSSIWKSILEKEILSL